MRYLKTIILLWLCAVTLTVTAQNESAEVDRLTKEMYRLYPMDSISAFMEVTDQLKALTRNKPAYERNFYKAWANQALLIFRRVDRAKGQEMLQEMRNYAEQHDNKFGLYTATSTNVSMMGILRLNDQAEKGHYECIDYLHRYFPRESAAADYLGLARINYNRSNYKKVTELAESALKEPNLNDVHRESALAYYCIAVSHLDQNGLDTVKFNNAYNEWRKLKDRSKKKKTTMDLIVEYNHARVNKDFERALAAANSIPDKGTRLAYRATAYASSGRYMEAYFAGLEQRAFTDSVNTAEFKKQATENSLQLELARTENEAKDLRLANQALALEHISDELEQQRLMEEALNLSLQKHEAELANAATKLQNDSLDKHNKDLQISEYQSKIEAEKSRERMQQLALMAAILIGLLVIGFLSVYLYRRNKHAKEIEMAYNKLEDAYERLEATTAAKERIESELRIARDIQMGMVPHRFNFPSASGIDLYASMMPAKEVGGDLYDFILQGQKLYLCVGDVSGKGVPASMTMAVAVNLFRTVAKEGFPPSYIATRLNDTLAADNESGMFVTMFIAEIDLTTGRMDFCNAGHNPPVIIDRPLEPGGSMRVRYLEMESNTPVGLWEGVEFVGESIENIKGRPLFIYTDGLNEAENHLQEQFGDDRLLHQLASIPFVSAQDTIEQIRKDIALHVGEAEQSDDLTMLCVRIS